MIRPELGQVVEWVEKKADIKPLLALRYQIDRGWRTDWPVPTTSMVLIPRWEIGGMHEVAGC